MAQRQHTRHAERESMCSVRVLERQRQILRKGGIGGTDTDNAMRGPSSTGHQIAAMECHGSIEKPRSKFISCAAKVQHCQETDRHAAVTDVYPDSQRFHLTWIGKRGAVKNIRFDFGSVDSKGLQNQDCKWCAARRQE